MNRLREYSDPKFNGVVDMKGYPVLVTIRDYGETDKQKFQTIKAYFLGSHDGMLGFWEMEQRPVGLIHAASKTLLPERRRFALPQERIVEMIVL